MRRAWIAYGVWLTFVAVAALTAAVWYRHVEQIGWRELADKLKPDDTGDDGGHD